MSGLGAVFATLRHNGALARVELAFLVATIVEWATWLALVVIAFDRGGAVEAGVIGFAIGIPAIVVAPAAAILGDRWPRSRVLLGAYAAQAVAFCACAAAFVADASLVGYAMGVAAMTLVGLVRPLLSSLLPEVARSPAELTASNVLTGLGEGMGALAGPLVAGMLFALSAATMVLVAGAGAMIVAAILILPLALQAERLPMDRLLPVGVGGTAAVAVLGRELAAGIAATIADRRLTVLTVLIAATFGVLAALSILTIVVAIDVLGLDEGAAGYLTAIGGLGALAGSALASGLVGRDRIALPLIVAVLGFALAVMAVGVASTLAIVAVALIAAGVGWSVAYIATTTLTQRLAGDDVMTRVFGVSESVQVGAEALGSLLVPVLVIALGPGGALVACGIGLLVVGVLAAPVLLRADRVDPAFQRDVAALRAVPMFGPLSGPVLERLAAGATRLTASAGEEIIREGQPGDRFYVIAAGGVRVSVHGRDARALGPGEAFGEIALLRDTPRTATVHATTSTDLLAIRREAFLEALTGQARSHRLAAEVAQDRLDADRAAEVTATR